MANLTALKLRIETSRFTESKAFYCDLLGLNVVESWSGGGPMGSILGLSNDVEAEVVKGTHAFGCLKKFRHWAGRSILVIPKLFIGYWAF